MAGEILTIKNLMDMETKEIKPRKKKLEMDIQQLISAFEKETEILRVDKVYVLDQVVTTELKVKL